MESVKFLVTSNPTALNKKDALNCTPLTRAVLHQHISIVKYLLEQKNIELDVKIEKCSSEEYIGATALFLSVQNLAIFRALVEAGSKLDIRSVIESFNPFILLRNLDCWMQ